jgi:hypothetical protein
MADRCQHAVGPSHHEVIMPRVHKKPLPIVAASPATVSAMFSIRPDDLARAIEAGLPVFKVGSRRRILIEDAISWLKSQPRYTMRSAHADD